MDEGGTTPTNKGVSGKKGAKWGLITYKYTPTDEGILLLGIEEAAEPASDTGKKQGVLQVNRL